MKKFKKIIAMCLATVMAMSVMCVGASAASKAEDIISVNGNVITISGEMTENVTSYLEENYGYRTPTSEMEGIKVEDNVITVEGELDDNTINYLSEKYGYRAANSLSTSSISPRGVNIPTATFQITDHNTHSSYYSITSFIYTNYCFYPHNIDGDMFLTLDPENNHSLRIQVCPKGSTTPVYDGTYNLKAGTKQIIRLDEAYFNSNTAYYFKFISVNNGGNWVTSDYSIT